MKANQYETNPSELSIQLSSRPLVLLAGNGFCRAAGQCSCDVLIESIRKEYNPVLDPNLLKMLPFPQQVVAASNDHVKENLKRIGKTMTEYRADHQYDEMFQMLATCGASAVLTPNYSNEIEQAFIDHYSSYQYRIHRRMTEDCRNEVRKLLYQYSDLSDHNVSATIWHIHGDAYQTKSMIMGHYYYGKLLNEIEQYVPGLIPRYKTALKQGEDQISVHSWVDYFLLGNLHIIGFNMDSAESDLWWLLCCKKRNFPEAKTYFYEPKKEDILHNGKEAMLKTYGVHIITSDDFDGNYHEYYKEELKNITNY